MRTLQKLFTLLVCLLLLPLSGLAGSGPVYEIFVASFYDSDGDGRGDLKGIAEKLDYIAGLKVDGLWLMPVHPSPSYHKYDVTDYLSVDSQYGTVEDVRLLAAAAGEKGIDLYLDLVINHSSSGHPWFLQAVDALKKGEDSPYLAYYHFSQSSGHPVPGVPGWFYLGHFGPHMPDLNLDSEKVREEITGILSFWLSLGVDGFRLDATTHYYEENTDRNREFLRWLTQQARLFNPDAYFAGEAWKDDSTALNLYESGIDTLFPFTMAGPTGSLVTMLREKRGEALARRVAEWNAAIRGRNPDALDAPFLSNHDMARSSGYLMYRPQAIKQAAAIYLTMPGRPYIYYGEELGLSGSGRDENKRLPMLWGQGEPGGTLPPADADQNQRVKQGVKEQNTEPDSVLRFYRDLLTLRAEHPVLNTGRAQAIVTHESTVAAWAVTDGNRGVQVYHNLSDKEVLLSLPQGDMAGAWDTGSGLPEIIDGQLRLSPHSGCVFTSSNH